MRYISMDERWTIHTLVFDLDDTLYDERVFVASGFAAVDEWLRVKLGIKDFQPVAQGLFTEGIRGRIFDLALHRLGILASEELVAEMVAVYRQHEPCLQLSPEARNVLSWARRERIKLALVTDGISLVQRNKIAALGLAAYIDTLVISDELGGHAFWKPHKAPFLKVMSDIPGEREGFVYVADNPRKDFIAPRALGWRTLRLRRPGTEHWAYEAAPAERAERDVITLADLPSIVQARDRMASAV